MPVDDPWFDCADMVRQYRKFDDQVIVRLNRAAAQLRDQSRVAAFSSSSDASDSMHGADGMCMKMWNEMMGGPPITSFGRGRR
jgi:hypothetical protein